MNTSVNRVGAVLADLIKAALVSNDARSIGFRRAADDGLAALRADPPDETSVRMEGAWTLAVEEAETPELQREEGRVNLTLPRACPYTLATLLADDFDVDLAVDGIRKSASTG